MAFLVGCEDGSTVSRYELGTREPNLRTAFACQVAFGVAAHELFPGIYEEVEKQVQEQARLLSEQPQASRSKRLHWYKRKLLDAIGSRKEDELAQAA